MSEDDARPRGGKRGREDGATTTFELDSIRAAGVPADAVAPALTVVSGTQSGRVFALTGLPITVGRNAECDVVLNGRGVSRKHFLVEAGSDGGQPCVVDLDSTNGVLVNGVQVRRHALEVGDRLQIGPGTGLKFSVEGLQEIEVRRRRYEESIRDGLTGAHNRRHFEAALEHEVAYSRRHEEALSILLIDLDHFKAINDERGHAAGDAILREVAQHLTAHLRFEDLVCRYGGEEFVVLLRGQTADRAFETAERLRTSLAERRFEHAGRVSQVTASFGVASLADVPSGELADLADAADRRLYEAKAAGRNRSVGNGRTTD